MYIYAPSPAKKNPPHFYACPNPGPTYFAPWIVIFDYTILSVILCKQAKWELLFKTKDGFRMLFYQNM
jgi:hypothetical protein